VNQNIQALTDRMAISLSLLCTIHCLAFPWAVILIPSLAALPLEGEALHLWLLIVIIPTSIFALTLGCRKHKNYHIVAVGAIGLSILITALFVERLESGEIWEKVLTVIGAIFIAAGHLWNYRLCHHHDNNCSCHDHSRQIK